MPKFLSYKQNDFRKELYHELERPVAEFRSDVRRILKEEAESAVKTLQEWVSDDRVHKITGDVYDSIGYLQYDTEYTSKIEVGFINHVRDDRTNAAISNIVGDSRMPIEPVHAEKLAYPILGVSPEIIAPRHARQLSIAEAREYYYLVFFENSIFGRLKGSKSRKLVFLYVRSEEEEPGGQIDMEELETEVEEKIAERLASEL